jgi:hypothetical protein
VRLVDQVFCHLWHALVAAAGFAALHFLLLLRYELWEDFSERMKKSFSTLTTRLVRHAVNRLLKGKKMTPQDETAAPAAKALDAAAPAGVSATQPLGSFGSASEDYSAGVGSASASAAIPATTFGLSGQVQVTVSLDAKILIGYLAGKIGGPVPAEVAAFLEAALAAS